LAECSIIKAKNDTVIYSLFCNLTVALAAEIFEEN